MMSNTPINNSQSTKTAFLPTKKYPHLKMWIKVWEDSYLGLPV